jgi:hypothetical protein
MGTYVAVPTWSRTVLKNCNLKSASLSRADWNNSIQVTRSAFLLIFEKFFLNVGVNGGGCSYCEMDNETRALDHNRRTTIEDILSNSRTYHNS